MNDLLTPTPARRTWLIRLLAGAFGATALLALAAVAYLAWPLSDAEQARRALDLARLAPMPTSATGVRVDGTSNFFSMTYLVRFHAPDADIEAFIRQSPGLSGAASEVLTPQHQFLPHSAAGDPVPGQHYLMLDARYPWFDPTIRKRGRRFEIPQDANACCGAVVVDDETHTVFITANRS